MINKIKKRIETELKDYSRHLNQAYSLRKISPILYRHIKNFLLRKGKRIRPTLFVIGYLGFAKKPAPGLYRSALSLELLHDFMLVHDDIIDKSDTRRGQPSMHKMLQNYCQKHKGVKFSGQDLTIVIGDVMYSMALDAFLSVKEKLARKEAAMRKLIEAAIYTGTGEFIELLYGAKNIERINKKDIYKIFDLKTANYTFASPLALGAILAGAGDKETKNLFGYGIFLGRAFQINDDILGMFGEEEKTGKSSLSDLREGKKTILIWQAYKNSSPKDKLTIKKILSKNNAGKPDLLKMRKIIVSSGALDYAKKEVSQLATNAQRLLADSKMAPAYKNLLREYSKSILKL